MEREMGSLFDAGPVKSDGESQADDLFYQALEADNDREYVRLLKAALKKNPRHIDAIVELSESFPPDRAVQLLEDAVAIGEEDLQQELRDDVGHFWGMLHTRPYMRARLKLAERKFDGGDLAAAALDYEEMLRLNPMDNQGVRWMLMEVYCRLDRLDDAERLLQEYPDDGMPFLSFTALLIRFRREGDSPELRAALRAQDESNPNIVARLLDPRLISHESIGSFSPASPEEADLYCRQFLSSWKATPGAISWLRGAAQDLSVLADESDGFDVKQEIQSLRRKVKKLESCPETWYCDAHHISADESEGWLLNLIVPDDDNVISMEPGADPYCVDTVLHGVLLGMLDPEDGEPRKPALIEFADDELQTDLAKRLERLGIESAVTDARPEMLEFIDQKMAGPDRDLEAAVEEIRDAPYSGADWEIDWRPIDRWLPGEVDGKVTQPWITLVVSDEGLVLAQQFTLESPDQYVIAAAIADAVLTPPVTSPARPTTICVPSADHQVSVRKLADNIDVECLVDSCPNVNEAFESLAEYMNDKAAGPGAMITQPEMTPAALGEFFEASAAFYSSRVWATTPPNTVIEVSCPQLLPGRWYAVLMGQMGEEIGIIFFDDPRSLQALFAADPSDLEGGAHHMRGLSYSLNEQQNTHPADVNAAEQFGWPVPAPEAWPSLYYISDGKLRMAEAAETKFAAAGTRAITAHLQSRKSTLETEVELAGEKFTVETRSD